MNGSGVRTKAAQVSTWSRHDVLYPHFDMRMHQPCHACTPCLHTHAFLGTQTNCICMLFVLPLQGCVNSPRYAALGCPDCCF